MAEPSLAIDARHELLENILPFWRRCTLDHQHGGFVAELSNDLRLDPGAAKGLVLNARILWTFSAACGFTNDARDADLAHRAYEYLTERFLDRQQGGFFWQLTPQGDILDASKKVYGQAFCIYALAEYSRVFNRPAALQQAVDLFHLLEDRARDADNGGYWETLSRDWRPVEDVRLSDKDMNEKKSMNNHLHVLEAYSELLRAWPDSLATERLRELIDIFRRRILNAGGTHFNHFFDEDWRPKSDSHTFGHDIEGSWLLCAAAEALGDPGLLKGIQGTAVKMARAVLDEGLDADGSLLYEARGGRIINAAKEWWPQAEAVVGFYNAWELTGDRAFLEAAERCWRFIQDRLVDRVHGEWFWRIVDGKPDPAMPKVSAWKCPYHNARCCLEIIRRARCGREPGSAE